MRDQWSKNLSDGRKVDYTLDITPGVGGVITAKVGDITDTASVPASRGSMTRKEVEERFGKK